MAEVGKRVKTLSMLCPEGYEEGRCITITHATGTVAYTAAGALPDGFTVGPASESRFNAGAQDQFTIEIITIASVDGAEFLSHEPNSAIIAQGAELEVFGALGEVRTLAGGTAVGLRANGVANGGELFGAYV